MYLKSLDIFQSLGYKKGLASIYGNLGTLYVTRGDSQDAAKMYLKSLEIHQASGNKEGMAIQYGNLGLLFAACHEFQKAEEMYLLSLRIFKEMKHPQTERLQQLLDGLKKES
jgi:tetratricopeptide (TPR) repeat protein